MSRRAESKRARPREPRPAAEPTRVDAPALRAPLVVPPAHRWLARALVAAVAIASFAPGLGNPLLDGWDDDRFLRDNPLVHEVSWANLVSILTEPHFQAYHPLHLLSYWLDVPWAGLEGPVLHAVSLALWVLALLAVLEASWALGLGLLGGLATALLVGVHPAQVEAVTWATGRKDILALGFAALSVCFHARSEGPWDARSWASRALYLAACLAKTSALPLPFVLLAADRLLLDRSWRRALVTQIPALVIALSLGAVTLVIWSDASMIRGRELDLADRISLVAATISHHLATAFWPSSLSPAYPIARGEDFGLFTLGAGPLALAAAAVLAWRTRRPRLAFALFAFAALAAPVSNLVPLYFQWQDRYLSLPLWPLAFALGAALDAWASRSTTRMARAAPVIALAALTLALGARTAQYAPLWRDRLTLFGHAASTHPGADYAWLSLGHARRDAGRLEGAIRAYGEAIDVANLSTAHDARFATVVRLDEERRGLGPSRVDALTARFHAALNASADQEPRGRADGLRELAGELAELGYRRAVMLALDYSFALDPVSDEQLARAAQVQRERGHRWLADFYLSRLRRPPPAPGSRR